MSEMGSHSEKDQCVKRAEATGSQITVSGPVIQLGPGTRGLVSRDYHFLEEF